MDYDDIFKLTPDELFQYNFITRERIKRIELKTLKKLNLSEDEKLFFNLIYKLKYDIEFRNIFTTLFIYSNWAVD